MTRFVFSFNKFSRLDLSKHSNVQSLTYFLGRHISVSTSGSIQLYDVWLIKCRFRFKFCFNRYYQPIRKGGAILVKFVADIAKKSELCPIGAVNLRNVKKQVQADIVELICVSVYNSIVKF
ncbi:F-actin-capping protein subunit alpha [Bienertia sinuspersici]